MLAREGTLTRPGGADEDDEAQRWDWDFHGRAAAADLIGEVVRLNTAICVGEPRSASWFPMPLSSNE